MQYNEILFDYKKEVLIHAVTRVNLENTVVSERSQIKNATEYDSIYMKCQNRQICEALGRLVVAWDCVARE